MSVNQHDILNIQRTVEKSNELLVNIDRGLTDWKRKQIHRSPDSLDNDEDNYTTKEVNIKAIHYQISLIQVRDFVDDVIVAKNGSWSDNRIVHFKINEPIRYFLFIKYLKYNTLINLNLFVFFQRKILARRLDEQAEDVNFNGKLKLNKNQAEEVIIFFNNLNISRVRREKMPPSLSDEPRAKIQQDTKERLSYLAFLKSCIKTLVGIEHPGLNVENKYSHLDFDVKIREFSAILFEHLWFNISYIELENGTYFELWDAESKFFV